MDVTIYQTGIRDKTMDKGLQSLGHPPETWRKVSFHYYNSHIFNMAKNVLYGIKHIEKTQWEHF